MIMPPITVVCQLSLKAIKAPLPSCSSNVGLANTLGTPNGVSSGPMARMMTLFGWLLWTMKPPIITLSAVWTKLRVLMLARMEPGVGVAEGAGVGVGVGFGVGDAFTTVTVPTMAQHPPCGTQ